MGLIALAVVALFASDAAAVDVTVKTDTKLYDPSGAVLAEVAAGRTFQAERLRGDWVYGFLSSGTGGARGWIRADALNLDDEARRTLAAASAPEPAETTESAGTTPSAGVALRFKLGLNQLQVYEAAQELSMEIRGAPGQTAMTSAVSDSVRVIVSVRGKGPAPDGTTETEVRFHDLLYEREMKQGPSTTRIEGDENGATLYRNGERVHSGRWDSDKLGAAPDFSKLLMTPYKVWISDRGQVKLSPAAEKIDSIDLELILGGRRVFPEGPVRPGASWTSPVTEEIDDFTGAGDDIEIAGTATYTLLGRGVHRGRRCSKIGMTAELTQADAENPMQIKGTLKGTSFVDEATGIPLTSSVELTMTMSGTILGVYMEGTGSAKLTASYKGNKLP